MTLPSSPVAAVGRPVRALLGALGFLSRLPVGRDERSWEAFRTAPWTLPLAGALLGALAALPVALTASIALPGPTVAFAYVGAVAALTGVNHFDGVADLGDAAVVHGGPERRREVMKDSLVGVGGALALGLVLLGLALGGLGLAALPAAAAVALVVAAEVSAKLAMTALLCLGEPSHDGFGARVAAPLGARQFAAPLALSLPAAGLAWPVGLAALAGGLVTAAAVGRWAGATLGGVSGDVFGAVNELARVVALHAGLLAWHLGGQPGGLFPAVAPALLARAPEVIAWTLS